MIGSHRIGILGAGGVVTAFHLPVLRSMPSVDVRWICDVDLKRARSVAAAFGVPRASSSLDQCGDVDIVLIAIPVGARREALDVATSRRWHAFCEKPFAVSADDHRWMIAKARSAGVRLGVGLVRRSFGSMGLGRELLRSGLLGHITGLAAGEGERTQRTGRDTDWYQADPRAAGGGALAETGVHVVDQLLTVCDAVDVSVIRSDQQIVDDLEFDTSSAGTILLADGISVPFQLRVSRLADVYSGVVIQCDRADVLVGPGVTDPVRVIPTGKTSALELSIQGPGDLLSAFRAQWMDFMNSCEAGSAFEDEETGLLTTTLIEACYRLGRSSRSPTPASSR